MKVCCCPSPGRTTAKKKYIGVRMMTLTPAYVRLMDQTLVICFVNVTCRWMINSVLWFPPPGYLKSWRLSTGTSLTLLLELMSWRLLRKRQLQCKKNICMCASHNSHVTPSLYVWCRSLLRRAFFTAVVITVQHGARSCLEWLPSKISPHNQSELWEMPNSAVSPHTYIMCMCGKGVLIELWFSCPFSPNSPQNHIPFKTFAELICCLKIPPTRCRMLVLWLLLFVLGCSWVLWISLNPCCRWMFRFYTVTIEGLTPD